MQQIEVSGDGITVTLVTEPLLSAFGTEMRPGRTDVYTLPWSEISHIDLSAMSVEHGDARVIHLTVDTVYGEYLEVFEQAGGFADAVSDLCRLSGLPVPDVAATPETGVSIWRSALSPTRQAGGPGHES
ncbi:hypothetical protein ACIA8K_17660 [Catenuloplanes sp. NPDC051500]|uniref:hypothetical protein n=1 Tax=Catenuloplanes sp. NPDC051500 TaxID=3363959 RepID=UPI0037B3A1A8